MTEAQKFLQSWQNEMKATGKVLKAFPAEKVNFKPHENSMSAKDLAVHLASR